MIVTLWTPDNQQRYYMYTAIDGHDAHHESGAARASRPNLAAQSMSNSMCVCVFKMTAWHATLVITRSS